MIEPIISDQHFIYSITIRFASAQSIRIWHSGSWSTSISSTRNQSTLNCSIAIQSTSVCSMRSLSTSIPSTRNRSITRHMSLAMQLAFRCAQRNLPFSSLRDPRVRNIILDSRQSITSCMSLLNNRHLDYGSYSMFNDSRIPSLAN
jgi:hypothetical protein